MPNAIGMSSRGSKPFLIARYRNTNATAIMTKFPHVRWKNAVCSSRFVNVESKSIYVLLLS